MPMRPILAFLMLLGVSLLASGCSDSTPPPSPWEGPGIPMQELNATFYWYRVLHPDDTTTESIVWLEYRARGERQTMDAGEVRFAGEEVPRKYYSGDGGYFYLGGWENPSWNIAGTFDSSFVITAAGTSAFAPFADTVPIRVAEPLIISPKPGDTISISKGFILDWNREWGAGKVQITFTASSGNDFTRTGRVADNGRLVVEPDMIEGMEPGAWTIAIEREYRYERSLSGSRRSTMVARINCRVSVVAEE